MVAKQAQPAFEPGGGAMARRAGDAARPAAGSGERSVTRPGAHAPPPALGRIAIELLPVLERHGVPAALALLNARTRYRFTGIYRVDPPLLRNVRLHDRENPLLNLSGDINLLRDTYCAITASGERPFSIPDGAADAALADLAARSSVLSYLGAPIRGPDGRVAGTLCHFDCRPRLAPDGEDEVVAWVAATFGGRLLDG